MTDILIKNGTLLTQDPKSRIIQDGAIAISDGIIKAVGTTQDLKREYSSAEKIIDAKKCAVLPGFVNTHGHLYQNLLKGGAAEDDLYTWIQNELGSFAAVRLKHMAEGDWIGDLQGTILACLENIRFGNTTIVGLDSPYLQIGEGFKRTGIRGYHAISFLDVYPGQPYPPPEAEAQLLRDEQWRNADRVYRRWHGKENDKIRIIIAPTTPYLNTPESFAICKQKADEWNTRIQIHISEVIPEVVDLRSRHGTTPVKHLENLGFLDERVTAVHCVWVTAEEISIFAKHGVHISHNPKSNMKLASGIMPLPHMLEAGLNIALATDGAASSDNHDMIETMRVAALLHRVQTLDPALLSATEILRMATINGAKALGIDDQVGSLEVGKKADIIVLDLSKPHNRPIRDIENIIIFCSQGSDIRDTIIDGKLVMENRKVLTVDEEAELTKADKLTETLWEEQRYYLKNPLSMEERINLMQKVKANPKSSEF